MAVSGTSFKGAEQFSFYQGGMRKAKIRERATRQPKYFSLNPTQMFFGPLAILLMRDRPKEATYRSPLVPSPPFWQNEENYSSKGAEKGTDLGLRKPGYIACETGKKHGKANYSRTFRKETTVAQFIEKSVKEAKNIPVHVRSMHSLPSHHVFVPYATL